MKNFAENWIANKDNNKFLGVVVWVIISLLSILLIYNNLPIESILIRKMLLILFLIGPLMLVWSSRLTVDPRIEEHLVDIWGESTEVYLTEGWYLTFFLFKFDEGETKDLEREKIRVGPVEFTDVDDKLVVGFVTAIWYPGDTEQEKKAFKNMKESEIVTNLQEYLIHSLTHTFSNKKFRDVKGQEHVHFKASELQFSGVRFSEVNPMLLSGNPTQDDFNAQFARLKGIKIKEFKDLTGRNTLLPKELKEIDDQILLELNRIRKIITDSPVLGRYDIPDGAH